MRELYVPTHMEGECRMFAVIVYTHMVRGSLNDECTNFKLRNCRCALRCDAWGPFWVLKSSKCMVLQVLLVSIRTFYCVRLMCMYWLGLVGVTAAGTILNGFCWVHLDTGLDCKTIFLISGCWYCLFWQISLCFVAGFLSQHFPCHELISFPSHELWDGKRISVYGFGWVDNN